MCSWESVNLSKGAVTRIKSLYEAQFSKYRRKCVFINTVIKKIVV